MESNTNNLRTLIITCPVCGYSFKPDYKKAKKEINCPMCGFKFQSMNLNSKRPESGSEKRIF